MRRGSITIFTVLLLTLHKRTWRSGGYKRIYSVASNGETRPASNAMGVLSAWLLLTEHEDYLKVPVRVSLEFAKMVVE